MFSFLRQENRRNRRVVQVVLRQENRRNRRDARVF